MGHQANFYATPADIAELEENVRKLESMIILHDRSPTEQPRTLPSLRFIEDGQPLLFCYLVREQDLSEVVTRHVSAQGYWVVDVLRSPVVEFNGCYSNGKVLRRGRLYFVDGFYELNDDWVEKTEMFRTWAKSMLRTAKKALKKHGADYIGKSALKWLDSEQGKLVI